MSYREEQIIQKFLFIAVKGCTELYILNQFDRSFNQAFKYAIPCGLGYIFKLILPSKQSQE